MPGYAEEALEERFQPYDVDRSKGSLGFTDGYIETDMETKIPVCVFYNEDNLAKIGLNVNRISGLGSYDSAVEMLSRDAATFESQYGTVVVVMLDSWDGDPDDDDDIYAFVGADIERPEWQVTEPLFDIYAPAPPEDRGCLDAYQRACWNVAMRMLRNFAE